MKAQRNSPLWTPYHHRKQPTSFREHLPFPGYRTLIHEDTFLLWWPGLAVTQITLADLTLLRMT